MTAENSLRELETASYFGVLGFGRSYSNLIYTLLTFPIGLTLFIYAWVCFPLFVGLSVILVVLPILYLFLWSMPRIVLVVGYLTKLFLGMPLPIKDDIPKQIEGSFFTKAFNALKDKRIGKSLVYSMFLALPFGTFVFSLMTTLVSVVGALIGAPIAYVVQFYLDTGDVWIDWVIAHIPTGGIITILIVAVLIGLSMIPAVLQLNNKLAIWHGKMVQKALTR
ncbi:MAG: sensor domain-containing protein [Candidatus Heimdallarchaeaceae archaeon]|jgi:hypothetical protein